MPSSGWNKLVKIDDKFDTNIKCEIFTHDLLKN